MPIDYSKFIKLAAIGDIKDVDKSNIDLVNELKDFRADLESEYSTWKMPLKVTNKIFNDAWDGGMGDGLPSVERIYKAMAEFANFIMDSNKLPNKLYYASASKLIINPELKSLFYEACQFMTKEGIRHALVTHEKFMDILLSLIKNHRQEDILKCQVFSARSALQSYDKDVMVDLLS